MNEKRVVVTGLGAITPLGNNVETLWRNIIEGKSGIDYSAHVYKYDSTVSVADKVAIIDPYDYIEKKEARMSDLFVENADDTSEMALKDSELKIKDENAERVGVWVCCGIGGMN